MSFEGQTCRKWANELEILDCEIGLDLPFPQGNIHVYNHNIQRSSLKPLDRSKTSLIGSICMKGKPIYL